MKTILDPSDLHNVQSRIRLLTPESQKKWGKMTAVEMLHHCTQQLRLALGEIEAPAQGPSFLRTSLGKWISLSSIPWPKGSPTPKEMNMKKNPVSAMEFESARVQLLHYIDKVCSAPTLHSHPFFGKLSQKEWGRLIYKHLDHHLKQFGQK